MRDRLPRLTLNRGLAWLLWLALALPLAQTAVHWHAFSHAWSTGHSLTDSPGGRAASSAPNEPQAPHAAHCDLCLAATAISGGALAGAPTALSLSSARHALPQAAAGSGWQAPVALTYSSRAPPTSAC